jgi:hypothetical protein
MKTNKLHLESAGREQAHYTCNAFLPFQLIKMLAVIYKSHCINNYVTALKIVLEKCLHGI